MLAWSFYDPSMLRWSDLDGDARAFRQNLSHFLSVEGVSGPYVFFDHGEGDVSDTLDGNVYVLDTRTGAIADTHTHDWWPVASRAGLLAFATVNAAAGKMRVLDTSKLPELTCS